MHMLRTLAFVEAKHRFSLVPQYIHTKANHLADDLSRNLLSSFFSKVPEVDLETTLVPQQLSELLLDQSLDWVSPCWLQLFNSTF